MQLRKCDDCLLFFRYPKDEGEESHTFYQHTYHEPIATDLPDPIDLPAHIATKFSRVARDFSVYIPMINSRMPHGRLLDYGCSWGYGVHQFQASGYQAEGFEISAPRARYGRDYLGVSIHSSMRDFDDGAFDIVFTSHVLEHIPNPAGPFADFQRVLRPGGLLMILVPNGGGKEARALGANWGPMINRNHVLGVTAEFVQKNLPAYGFTLIFGSEPYHVAPAPLCEHPDLNGSELLVFGMRI